LTFDLPDRLKPAIFFWEDEEALWTHVPTRETPGVHLYESLWAARIYSMEIHGGHYFCDAVNYLAYTDVPNRSWLFEVKDYLSWQAFTENEAGPIIDKAALPSGGADPTRSGRA
jgi:hypothetical protein